MEPQPDEPKPPPSEFWTRAQSSRFGIALLSGPVLFLAAGLMSKTVPSVGTVFFWTGWGATLVGSGFCAHLATRGLHPVWRLPAYLLAAFGYLLLSLVLSYPGCALMLSH